jgi:hypothetical protein
VSPGSIPELGNEAATGLFLSGVCTALPLVKSLTRKC